MSIAPVPRRTPGPPWRPVLGWPSTRAGQWAAGLAGGVVVLFPLLGVLAGANASDWGWGARLALILAGLAGVATALSAGIVSIVAVVRRGERSIVLLAPILLGAFWAMFVLGEFLSPH